MWGYPVIIVLLVGVWGELDAIGRRRWAVPIWAGVAAVVALIGQTIRLSASH